MVKRRDFIRQVSTAGLLCSVPDLLMAGHFQQAKQNRLLPDKLWGSLLHLSFNFWEEYRSDDSPLPYLRTRGYLPDLQLSETLWNDSLLQMSKAGMNMVLIDLGDAIRYKSHPEIAVKNAWKPEKLKAELQRIRKLGLEPIPKLNFSAGHDTWLGEYSRMLSTEKYYRVCRELISEVIDIFDKPRFFHLGMDEEVAEHQKFYNYVVIRQNDLWWHDLYFLIGEVEKGGSRPWIWSDYVWHHPEIFFRKMPKSVVQSNWYYRDKFDKKNTYVKAYTDLEAHGYDQIPTASNYYETDQKSMFNTVQHCQSRISDEHLLGFLQTFWVPTTEPFRESIIKGIDQTGEARDWFLKGR